MGDGFVAVSATHGFDGDAELGGDAGGDLGDRWFKGFGVFEEQRADEFLAECCAFGLGGTSDLLDDGVDLAWRAFDDF